jgi:hypothetical protein
MENKVQTICHPDNLACMVDYGAIPMTPILSYALVLFGAIAASVIFACLASKGV